MWTLLASWLLVLFLVSAGYILVVESHFMSQLNLSIYCASLFEMCLCCQFLKWWQILSVSPAAGLFSFPFYKIIRTMESSFLFFIFFTCIQFSSVQAWWQKQIFGCCLFGQIRWLKTVICFLKCLTFLYCFTSMQAVHSQLHFNNLFLICLSPICLSLCVSLSLTHTVQINSGMGISNNCLILSLIISSVKACSFLVFYSTYY